MEQCDLVTASVLSNPSQLNNPKSHVIMATVHNQITIINRTAYEVFWGVDPAIKTSSFNNKFKGSCSSPNGTQLGFAAPGEVTTATVSGTTTSEEYRVGFCTQPVASGNPIENNQWKEIHGTIVYGVYNDSVVTITSQLATHTNDNS